MADIIQLPIDTAANWTLYNPVLAEGMPGFESDTDKFKVGDGLSSWTELNYGAAVDLSSYATTSAVAAGYVALTGNQTVAGVKTFSSTIASVGATITPTANGHSVLRINKADGSRAITMGTYPSADAYSVIYLGSTTPGSDNFTFANESANNETIINTGPSGLIKFKIGNAVEPLRLSDTGASVTGNLTASGNINAASFGTTGAFDPNLKPGVSNWHAGLAGFNQKHVTFGYYGGSSSMIGVSVASTGVYSWSDSGTDSDSSRTLMLGQQSAGVLQIGTTANNAAGSLALTNLTASGTGTFSSISETSVAATGTGALVRAASPTVTGTLNVPSLSVNGTLIAELTDGSGIPRLKATIAAKYSDAGGNSIWLADSSDNTTRVGLNRGDDGTIIVAHSGSLGWAANSGDVRIQSVGLGLDRASADVVEINNGTVGTLRDLSLRNLTASGTVSANSFSDGYITWSAAQINRSSNFVELQYDGSGGVRCFGNTATPITLANNGNLTASGTIRVGGGTVVANILSATATLDFPSIGSNDTETLTITVTGAVAGDSVFLGCPSGLDAGLIFCASVTAADTVTVRMHNSSGGAIDPASGTFRATVIRF